MEVPECWQAADWNDHLLWPDMCLASEDPLEDEAVAVHDDQEQRGDRGFPCPGQAARDTCVPPALGLMNAEDARGCVVAFDAGGCGGLPS